MPHQLTMSFASSATYHAADFIRGAANEDALEWIERWPDWPYSIVLLTGPSGSGKTHLAHVLAAKGGASFIAPERIGSIPADQLLIGNHCWIIDGLEKVTDAPAFAQLINHVRSRGDYLLLTSQQPVAELDIPLPDLRSRLLSLPMVELGAPDDALLAGVLAKEFADRQLRIAPEVLSFAIQQLERSYATVQRFAAAMDELSLARGRAITLPLVREVMRSASWQEV